MSLIAEIQRSQLITTYGIGSIYDALDYSVIIAGLENWRPEETEILHEERLQQKLKVDFFRQPRVIEDVATIPSFRFPEWVFCPKCKSLKPIYNLQNRTDKKCGRCKVNYVPVRFIVSCPKGHLDDFPWSWWVHKGNSCERPKLKIHTTGRTTSLAGIRVSCENEGCEASRSLEGIFGKNALRGLRCRGKMPWLGPRENEDCNEIPRVLQRGSASVYYSVTESAISIPPFSERIYSFLNGLLVPLEQIPDDALPNVLRGLLEKTGEIFSVEALVEAVKTRKNKNTQEKEIIDLRQAEYEALCHPEAKDAKDEFVAEEEEISVLFRDQMARLVLVSRLREVRALTGFTRIAPDGPAAPISKKPLNWLPAAEMKGEGLFIELNRKTMAKWVSKSDPKFLRRVNKLEKMRMQQLCKNKAWAEKRVINPQFLLIHTLAHILIQQLILDCGYSSSALRERLYINDGSDGKPEMSGFLIYTATSDSEGSLGGLVRQGKKNRFTEVMKKAIEQARWCSNDPLCMESEGQGHNSLNLAACHSCCLLPETSCELRNCYLDRGVLIGTNGRPETGFFPDNF